MVHGNGAYFAFTEVDTLLWRSFVNVIIIECREIIGVFGTQVVVCNRRCELVRLRGGRKCGN